MGGVQIPMGAWWALVGAVVVMLGIDLLAYCGEKPGCA